MIPADFPWRLLHRDELREAEAAWLESHPGWKTRIQKGPPTAANGAANGSCCSGGVCVPAEATVDVAKGDGANGTCCSAGVCATAAPLGAQ